MPERPPSSSLSKLPPGEGGVLGAAGDRLDPGATSFRWRTLRRPRPPAPDPAARVAALLRQPTDGPALAVNAPAVVLVPDSTRSAFVRPIVEALGAHFEAAGLKPGGAALRVAGGLHRPPTAGELEAIAGRARGFWTLTIHDADDPTLVQVGTTRRGTPVHLPEAVLRARTLVLVGGVTPHYFAGWTGGFKGLVPGAAGRATITANHRLAVAPSAPGGLHPACREGRLSGNPVYADLVEAAAQAPAPFLVNAVLGREGEVRAVVAGSVLAAHRRAVRLGRRALARPTAGFPLVLVAAAEPGRERDWIQAHKVVRQGAAWVAAGGTLVALAACADGIGSETLLDWFAVGEQGLAKAVATRYTIHGHTALAMRALTRRMRVILVSRLEPDLVRRMGMTPAASLAEALGLAARTVPAGAPALLLERA